MKKKNLIAGLFVASLLVAPSSASALSYTSFQDSGISCSESTKDVTLHVDGKYVYTDSDPVLKNNRTLVPMRAAGEALKADITWDDESRTATAIKDGKIVKFTIGSKYYSVNGQTHKTDVAPSIIKNRTMLPIRAFADAFGVKVDWNSQLYDVMIDTPALDVEPFIPVGANKDEQKYIAKYYVHSDLNDPHIGSWHNEIKYSNGVTDYYNFVTKINEGRYNVVQVSISDTNDMKTNTIVVMKDDSVFYSQIDGAIFYQLHCDNIPSYYRGPVRGFGPSLVFNYAYYPELDETEVLEIIDHCGEPTDNWMTGKFSRF